MRRGGGGEVSEPWRERVEVGDAVLMLGDCNAILPSLAPADAIIADPPYGIGKAEWDTTFSLGWVEHAARVAHTVAIMPGTWNLLRLPHEIAGLRYKWTLSAHLTNGMTKGGFGWGNWIPCVVYMKDRGQDQPEHVQAWCRRFSEWCTSRGISRRDLDRVCGTSDMGGWYLGLLPYRCQIPAPHQWAKIQAAFDPPSELAAEWIPSDYAPQTDCKAFAVGNEPKPDHPSPKPLNVTRWFVETLDADTICDPFMGSGTTGVACAQLGKRFVGIEKDERYFTTAVRRITEAQRQGRLFDPPRQRAEQLALLP